MLKQTSKDESVGRSLLLFVVSAGVLALAGCSSETIGPGSEAPASVASPAGADFNGYWRIATRLSEFDPPPAGETGPIQDIRGMEAMRAEGRYAVYLGDYNNPLLQPWAAEALQKHVEQERQGLHTPTPQEACRPSGVPNIFTIPTSIYVAQTGDHVAILYQRDHQFRIIRLNQQHPPDLQPSYYGDSVGYWEGDTLVVDTIGQNDKTPVDVFNTPHTDQIHVVERFRLVDAENGDKHLQIHFTVEDPGAFTGPWSSMVHFRPIQDAMQRFPSPLDEEVCAENDRNYGETGFYDIPVEAHYQYPE